MTHTKKLALLALLALVLALAVWLLLLPRTQAIADPQPTQPIDGLIESDPPTTPDLIPDHDITRPDLEPPTADAGLPTPQEPSQSNR